jgi:uncharacterized membrane protein YphA (DoxX/SURF4 family)
MTPSVAPFQQIASAAEQPKPWPLSKRVAFRFAFAFFVPFLFGGFGGLPLPPSAVTVWDKVFEAVIGGPSMWLVRHWLGPHVLHIQPVLAGPSSPAWYMRWLVVILTAALAAAIWSVLDRRRTDYRKLHSWLCMFLRISLGGILLGFGLSKVLDVQMTMSPSRLMQSFGSASPMGLLWTFMAGSPLYQVFTGIIETIAAVALFVPGLATLGAFTAVIAMTTVLVLDIAYNVQVKTNAANDLIMALFLLLPNMKALFDFVVLNP